MAITNGYCTLAELKAHIAADGGATFSASNDTNMEIAIEAVSRWLDNHFGTSFYARTETRYYTAEWPDLLHIDDLLTVTTLKTDENDDGTYEITWTTSDYILEPRNAAAGSQPKPYRQIRRSTSGDYSFPAAVPYAVEIAGTWGYSTAANQPKEIKQATLLMAHRLWRRKDTIFGIAGAPALGVTVIQARIQADSDIMLLLEGVDRRGF